MQPALNSVIFAQVADAIEQTFLLPIAAFLPSTRISDDLAIGRFGRFKLIVLLEEIFDVEFPNETVIRFKTLGDIVSYLDHRVRPAVIGHDDHFKLHAKPGRAALKGPNPVG